MTQKKTIALVANTSWNIHNFRLNVIRELEAQGYKVCVIAPTDKYIAYRNRFPQVKHFALYHLNRKSLNPLKDLVLLRELVKTYQKANADVYIQYTIKPNIYGSFAALLTQKKCISIITGLGYTFIHNGYVNKIAKLLYRVALRKNKKVIFENQEDRLLFLQSSLVKESQAHSIKGCGVDTDYFKPMERTHLPTKGLTFVFIGRLLIDKGIREYVEAARKIKSSYPDTKFWVVGQEDPQNPATISKQELVTWIDEGVVEYKGFHDDVRQVIRNTDCVVLPSYREAIPRVIQEGMAMAKPVITTDVPGCREAVDEGKNGYLVKARESQSLADAMTKILEHSEAERITMGKLGLEKVLREFDERLIAKQIVKMIQAVT